MDAFYTPHMQLNDRQCFAISRKCTIKKSTESSVCESECKEERWRSIGWSVHFVYILVCIAQHLLQMPRIRICARICKVYASLLLNRGLICWHFDLNIAKPNLVDAMRWQSRSPFILVGREWVHCNFCFLHSIQPICSSLNLVYHLTMQYDALYIVQCVHSNRESSMNVISTTTL